MNRTTTAITNSRLLGYAAVAGLAAVAVNATIYAAGRAADVEFIARQTASGAHHVQLVHVVGFTLQTFVVGVVAALVVNRLRRPSLHSLLVLGAVIAVGSTVMDVGIDSALPAKFLLASMHIVTGIAYVAALRTAGVRRPVSSASIAPAPITESLAA